MARLDFRRGGWGHAMHGFTWRVLPDRCEKRRFKRAIKHNRASVMLNTPRICEGDEVVYATERGERIATVAEVQPCGNPWDMFTVVLENFREYDAAALSTAPPAEGEG
jgi:hypothetical protein